MRRRKESKCIVPKKAVARSRSGMKKTEGDEGKTQVKNRHGAFSAADEGKSEADAASNFAGQAW